MTHGSLFSGIGGFELAARWMGWDNVFHVERNPFCRKVIAHHFPESQSFDDVKAFDATPFRGRIRVLSGGFPCQPFSAAGKRAGTSDDRYLWPEMFRIIREARPTYVVAENVRGLISWNEGLVLDTVCADLESEGYEVFPVVLPAASINAPHRRDRIWIVAYRDDGLGEQSHQEVQPRGNAANDGGAGSPTHAYDQRGTGGSRQVQGTNGEVPQRNDDAESCNSGGGFVAHSENVRLRKTEAIGRKRREQKPDNRAEIRDSPDPNGAGGDVTNAQRDGLEHGTERRGVSQSEGEARQRVAGHPTAEGENRNATNAEGFCLQGLSDRQGKGESWRGDWSRFPTQPPVCGGNDGLPAELDGITFPKWRANSIKAYGNAIVPQVAYQIFDTIRQMESTK